MCAAFQTSIYLFVVGVNLSVKLIKTLKVKLGLKYHNTFVELAEQMRSSLKDLLDGL